MEDAAASPPQTTPVLVVGDWHRAEMADVRQWLEDQSSQIELRHSATLPITQRDFDERWSPALVIVCQSWPDEFPARIVTAALGHWPLAQWVCCYGRWCDSDGRTRTIWPIGIRVPADAALPRLTRVWNVIQGSAGPPLPLTGSRDEAFEFDHCP